MILAELADYLRHKQRTDPAFHIVGDGATAPDDLDFEPGEPGVRRSAVVEGEAFFTKAVPSPIPPTSGFTHFLDGIQRSRLVGYQGIVPLIYGFTAAVIRERKPDRCLGCWTDAVVKEGIYAPEGEIDAEGMRGHGIPVYDTSRSLQSGEEGCPARYKQAAISAIQRARAEVEAQLARQWVSEAQGRDGAWLFVDGSLTFATQHAQVAGIIKSHQTQYFGPAEQARILRLEVGERSAVFQPGFGEAMSGDVYSWYLRLHSCAGRDLTYGLVRIEVDRRAEVIEEADAISAWLLAERQPLAAPDPRWDKLLYPIRDCEEYLRSIAPSPAVMEGILA